MNEQPFGRLVGLIVLAAATLFLGAEYYSLDTNGVYHMKWLGAGCMFLFLGLTMLIKPGAPDMLFNSSDNRQARSQKSRDWLSAIGQQPKLLVLYGVSMGLGLALTIYADAYFQNESLTDWSVPLRILLMLSLMALIGWWFLRPKKRGY